MSRYVHRFFIVHKDKTEQSFTKTFDKEVTYEEINEIIEEYISDKDSISHYGCNVEEIIEDEIVEEEI